MRVPIRKPGKYTHQKPDFHLTREKLDELKNKLERFKKISHPQARVEMQRTAEMGDFSENAAYQVAKGRLRGINNRIEELEKYIDHAEIIETGGNADTVQLGQKVTVEIGGKQKTYTILGSLEVDPQKGIISPSSPIGSVLMGHKVGDAVRLKLADDDVECRILAIEAFKNPRF